MREPPPVISYFFIFLYKGAIITTFDFEKFANIAASVYPQSEYSLQDALRVFRYYFEQYEKHLGTPHPPIRASQIVRICQDMPYISQEDRGGYCEDVSPDDYCAIIDKHFSTHYRHCDYNINHFFSGRIRELRFYDELF